MEVVSGIFSISTTTLSWPGALQIVGHRADKVNHLIIVVKLLDVALDLINGLALRDDEALTVTHLRLNGIEEQIVALLFLRLDRGDVAGENLHIFWLVDFDVVVAAGIE